MLTRSRNWGLLDFDRNVERTLVDFDVVRREMNRLFEGYPATGRLRAGGSISWPRIELFDKASHLLVRAEVPGMSEKEVQVTVDQGVLTLRGERTVQPPEGYSAHRQERSNYRFARSFSLPCKVDLEKTKAELKHGVLTLTLPKAPEEQPKQIAVNVQ